MRGSRNCTLGNRRFCAPRTNSFVCQLPPDRSQGTLCLRQETVYLGASGVIQSENSRSRRWVAVIHVTLLPGPSAAEYGAWKSLGNKPPYQLFLNAPILGAVLSMWTISRRRRQRVVFARRRRIKGLGIKYKKGSWRNCLNLLKANRQNLAGNRQNQSADRQNHLAFLSVVCQCAD